MPPPARIALAELRRRLVPADIFVCSASFESRCRSVPEQLGGENFTRVLVCANENFPHVVKRTGKKLLQFFGDASRYVPLNTNQPIRTADSLQAAVEEVLSAGHGRRFLVDITTFTHESLLMLLRVLRLRGVEAIQCVYTSAKQYSVGEPDNRKWLSKGIGEVRSVLGYPGRAVPSNRLHLIVMAGFEADRAERLIEEYQPSKISLGLGNSLDSISAEHYKTNTLFHRALAEKYSGVSEFSFSCIDAEQTRTALRAQAELFPDHNVVVAPLNTKISTIGAGLFALEDEGIQICYATAHQYNEKYYSTPGDYCYYFPVSL